MAIQKIPISKGVFRVQNQDSLRNSEFAEDLINTLLDEAGGNYDRPTLALHTTLESVHAIGMYYFSGLVLVVTLDRNFFTVDASGNINNVTGQTLLGDERPVFTDNGTTVFIVGGETPLKWTPGGLTETLAGSPPSMTHILYSDGYLIGNRRLDSERNKVIQFSDLDTTETWSGSNIFSANATPDEVMSIALAQRELYIVGEVSTEVWQNIGTSPVPFARAFVWDYGTPARYSVISEDNSLFFLTQKRQIIKLSGRQVMRLSEGIEDTLKSYASVDDCFAGKFKWDGSMHILFCFPTSGAAWSIDLKNNQWTEWRGYGDSGWARVRINCLVYSEMEEAVYAGDFLTGKIWKFSRTEKTDAGGIFKKMRTLSTRDSGATVRKRAEFLRFGLKRNIASSFSGETSQTNPTLELRWKDDDKPWSEYRRASLGEIGEQRNYIEFRRLGIFRSRQYQYQMSDPAELNISTIETEETVMAR